MVARRYGISLLMFNSISVSYTHLRAHETREDLVCRLLLEKKLHISAQPCIILPIYRGYYMTARGYEFYLRVLKLSRVSAANEEDAFSMIR